MPFAAGSQKLYDYLNDNPVCMAAPVSYTNDVRVVAQLDNFMSINNAVDVDLFGQVNAESAGTKYISGAGGQLDFVMGPTLPRAVRLHLLLLHFHEQKTGQLESRIKPTLDNGSIVTDTRANTHFLVTEYGKVNLKGTSTWERAEKIISIAHPDFRDQLSSPMPPRWAFGDAQQALIQPLEQTPQPAGCGVCFTFPLTNGISASYTFNIRI